MEWSLAIASDITRMIISMNWAAWIVILPTLGISLWYLARQAVYSNLRSWSPQSFSPQSALRYSGAFFCKFFLIPLLLSLPVYFTAYDYGRWFTVTCINFAMLAVSVNLPCWEFTLRRKGADKGSAAADSQEHLDNRLIFYGASIIICILALVLLLPHYCLFSCEIIRSPLQFFSHSFIAH
jgi:Sec-independent protein secretion pathway component TatC